MVAHGSTRGDKIDAMRTRLLDWFRQHGRDLPWRHTRDPYAILVSEVMLQQTQVDRVIPYYERFLERFPNVGALASAPTADVIRMWSGLGYNRRAVNLQRAAQAVVDQFDGVFPEDLSQLRSLPGVGAYTAGAIAAFAFEQDVAFLDTNMRRVVSRVLFGTEQTGEREALHTAESLVPPGHGWEWNQALIEFGALQCTARKPACVVCPLQSMCAAFPSIQGTLAARRSRVNRTTAQPFESTPRYFRGRIVEELRGLPESDTRGIDLVSLGSRVREGFSERDVPWLRGLVEDLQRDGLAVIAEDSPRYDVGSDTQEGNCRVRLP